MRRSLSVLASILALVAACGGDDGNGSSDGKGGAGTGGGNDGPTSWGAGNNGSGDDGKDGTFVYGMNGGYYNGDLNDVELAHLGVTAGVNSQRMKLMEPFLDEWGNEVRLPQTKEYLGMGMEDLVCFVVGMTEEHSNAPPGESTDHYSPKNLYEPIFTDDGEVNPNNHWAKILERLVKTYGSYIHQWEVWNEPNQVGGNWQATTNWDTDPPNPSNLVWWNDSIFTYIRMLRVTYQVVHKFDPKGKVTLGGIGYNAYLDALLRYTDEPTAGRSTKRIPRRGVRTSTS